MSENYEKDMRFLYFSLDSTALAMRQTATTMTDQSERLPELHQHSRELSSAADMVDKWISGITDEIGESWMVNPDTEIFEHADTAIGETEISVVLTTAMHDKFRAACKKREASSGEVLRAYMQFVINQGDLF